MDGRPQIQRKLSLSSTSIPDTGEKVNLRMTTYSIFRPKGDNAGHDGHKSVTKYCMLREKYENTFVQELQ